MPAELVNRLARMFQDIKVSHDLTREFQEKASNNNPSGGTETVAVLVSIKILSSGTWLPRSLPKFAVALPPELEDFIPQVNARLLAFLPIRLADCTTGWSSVIKKVNFMCCRSPLACLSLYLSSYSIHLTVRPTLCHHMVAILVHFLCFHLY